MAAPRMLAVLRAPATRRRRTATAPIVAAPRMLAVLRAPAARRRRTATALIAAALGMLAMLPASAAARDRFDVRVLTHIPPPGYPALTLIAPDRTIYVGTFYGAAGGDNGPSKVFAVSPDGRIERTYTISGQTPGQTHGIQVAARDAHGILYLLDQNPPRVLKLDPRSGRQTTYATFADVPPCPPAGTAPADCSDTVADNPPEPDYAAWGTDGSMYVTDYQQGLIWRVAPGGGMAHVWFTDPRLDGSMFGPAGIVLMPDHRTLIFDTSAGGVATPGDPTTGKLYTLPIGADGKPGELRQLWESGPREGPDGFALAASGNVYMALVGPGANQLVEISPDGHELARVPASAAAGTQMQVPFDEPSSVQFDGERMIVTNDPYFSGDQSHMVLFDVFAGEPGAPIFVPPAPPRPTRGRYALSVRPRRVRLGHTYHLHVIARLRRGRSVAPAAGMSVSVGGARARTDGRGRATLTLRTRRSGRYRVRLTAGGHTVAVATVRVPRPRTRRPRRVDGALAGLF